MGNIIKYLKVLLPGVITVILIILTGAFILKFTSFPEEWSSGITLVSISSGCLVSGLLSGLNLRHSGIITGFIVSIVLIVSIHISLSAILYKTVNLYSIIAIKNIIPLISGTVGGIAGSNLKK